MTMRSLFRIILPVSLIFLIASGCRKNYILSDEQEILFQYEYQNQSLEPRQSGYFIDKDGNLLTYDNPTEWNHPDNDLIICEEKLLENLDKCTLSDKSVLPSELEKFARHIPNISSSKVSALRNTGADKGSHTFICYKFDETFKVYKGYLIKMEGDYTCENLNFYSKKIVSWMKDINQIPAISPEGSSVKQK